ncbi:MAG TPA: VF530 family DNA-binding protein [Candidatus Eisenbacteria bacterium]
MMLRDMVDHAGWEGLARDLPIKCFRVDPSMTSALKYLRKAPRARKKVEDLYARFASRRRAGAGPTERSARTTRPSRSRT